MSSAWFSGYPAPTESGPERSCRVQVHGPPEEAKNVTKAVAVVYAKCCGVTRSERKPPSGLPPPPDWDRGSQREVNFTWALKGE